VGAVVQSDGGRRSAKKRAAMLDAAQQLFLADGYERTSIEAIAAGAKVSKRTVYDHFGDKELVYAEVVSRVSADFFATVETAIEEELPDGCDLRAGLLAFVRRVAAGAFSSSDTALRRLGGVWPRFPRSRGETGTTTKELGVHRFARFMADGALAPADPHRVVEHFTALTLLLAMDTLDPAAPDAELDAMLVDGVDAFLRAYT